MYGFSLQLFANVCLTSSDMSLSLVADLMDDADVIWCVGCGSEMWVDKAG